MRLQKEVECLIVYHGSDYEFNKLKVCPEHTWPETHRFGQGIGVYFSDLVSEAWEYGHYLYEIEVPDDLARCHDYKWRMDHYSKFAEYIRSKTGIDMDKCVRRYCRTMAQASYSGEKCSSRAVLRTVLNNAMGDGPKDFGRSLIVEVQMCLDTEDDTFDKVFDFIWKYAEAFDEENSYDAYWFEIGRDTHKGIVTNVSDRIKLLSRTCTRDRKYEDLITGIQFDLNDYLDAWFVKAGAVLSDRSVNDQVKEKIVQENMRFIKLWCPTRWKKIVKFLEKIRNGRVAFDPGKSFCSYTERLC